MSIFIIDVELMLSCVDIELICVLCDVFLVVALVIVFFSLQYIYIYMHNVICIYVIRNMSYIDIDRSDETTKK